MQEAKCIKCSSYNLLMWDYGSQILNKAIHSRPEGVSGLDLKYDQGKSAWSLILKASISTASESNFCPLFNWSYGLMQGGCRGEIQFTNDSIYLKSSLKVEISLNVVMLMLLALQENITTDPLRNQLQKCFILLAMWACGCQVCIPKMMLVCVQIYKPSFIHTLLFQTVRLFCLSVFWQRNFWQVNYDRAKQRHFRVSTITPQWEEGN